MNYKINSASYVQHLRNNGITCLYHFTSRRNLESIKRPGGLYSWWYMDQHGILIKLYIENRYPDLILKRLREGMSISQFENNANISNSLFPELN